MRLHPNDAITTKSPYITQCSAFSGRPTSGDANSGGGVGCIIDKSIYSVTSNGSMLFDSFTQFHDGGVGFWCKDLGNAEIVSSFTYYAHIGYTCTGGGRIRSVAGNNSTVSMVVYLQAPTPQKQHLQYCQRSETQLRIRRKLFSIQET